MTIKEGSSSRQPIRTLPYTEQYSDLSVLRRGLFVPQGRGRVSTNGENLYSDGLGKCNAGIVRNLDTNNVFLAHFLPLMELSERDAYIAEIESLGPGEKRGILLQGSISFHTREAEELFSVTGVHLEDIIQTETARAHWGVAYPPDENLIYVDQRFKKQVIVYEGFAI